VDISIQTTGTTKHVIADAVIFMLLEEKCGPGSLVDPADNDLIARCKPSDACPTGSFLQDKDTCVPCPPDTFSIALDSATCRPHQQCAPGAEQDQAPSATSDRTCKSCRQGTWSDGSSSCAQCTANCTTGYVIQSECILERDTVCQPQGSCDAGQYIQTPANGIDQDVICSPCTVCLAGTYVTDACRVDQDTKCQPCDTLTGFSADQNATECTPFSPCFSGSYESVAPSKTADRTCNRCSPGETDHDGDVRTECVPCSGGGYYVPLGSVGACETFLCDAGTYDDDGKADSPCKSCLDIDGYQPEAGQQECIPMATCAAGTYQVGTPRGLENRNCVECPTGRFQAAPGMTSCDAARVCKAGEEEVMALTSSSDRMCQACSNGKFQPTEGSARPCQPYSTCGDYQYTFLAPSATNDVECREAYPVTWYFSSYEGAPANNPATQSWLRNQIILTLVEAITQIRSAADVANVIYLPSLEPRYNVFVGANITFKSPSVASAVASRSNLTLTYNNVTFNMGHVMPSVVETTTSKPQTSQSAGGSVSWESFGRHIR
jgi:hypothetical protein